MNPYLTNDTVRLLLPEIMLLVLATWIFVAGAMSRQRSFHLVALCGLALVCLALYRQDAELLSLGMFQTGGTQTSGPLVVDFFGHALRWLALLVGFAFVLLAGRAGSKEQSTEYLGSLLLVIAGTMLLCMASELVLLFLAVELISIPTYILLYLGRRDAASQEATAKYFYLSILSSALLLYGLSFLYGISGSTELVEIRENLLQTMAGDGGLARLAPLALVLTLGGIAFKMAAVPFHFYAPDVYQGTTNTNAGVLAVVPKLAGMVVLVRLIVVAMPGIEQIGWQLLLAISIVTMTLGNVLALWQQNIRRMMAYSSIAHAGYMLMGLAVALAAAGQGAAGGESIDGLAAALFYLVVYIFATTGVFAALTYLSSERRELDRVDQLAGLGTTRPLVAIAMAVFMFSLTGIPPLAGFWGKLTLLVSALSVRSAMPAPHGYWFLALAVIAALNAAISAGYYLRVVAVMFFRSPENASQTEGSRGAWFVTVAMALLVVIVGCTSSSLITIARDASRSVRQVEDSVATVSPQISTKRQPANYANLRDNKTISSFFHSR